MKKILSVIILSTFLVTGSPKPAQAIIIDPAQIAAKIAEIVQDIADAVQTAIQEVNKVKQMAAQGFNYQALIDKAAEYATKYAVDYVTTKLLSKRFKEVEGDTNKQNKKVLEKDKENYQEATNTLYDEQIKILDQEISKTGAAENEALQKTKDAKSHEAEAKTAYEAETNPEAKNQKLMEYLKWSAEAEKWNNDFWELNKKSQELLKQKEYLLQEKEKVPTDDQSKALDERIKAMEKDENELIVVDPKNAEWDEVNIDDFDINKHYEKFVKQYFFDPEELGDAGKEGVIQHQSRIDRIMRQRRYLFVNSAAHLMQVTATMRRSLPVHYKKNKDMFTTIGQDEGELAAMNVYSSTRIEGARALLMYAKLLCAKLQYETARDLVKSEVQKNMQDGVSTEFDLEKYILDSKDVKAMLTKFSYETEAENERANQNSEYNDTSAYGSFDKR